MKAIAFYLPQFHPIPENDEWWGKGFTEWTNVASAKPQYRGHYQPHIPSDLGFYDLRLKESRLAQAELAEKYGVGGFCYYHYWFNGKLLLERPICDVLQEESPRLPFCFCWANETWSRRWDGQEQEILIDQDLRSYDPASHIEYLSKSFNDPRYIRINGRPLFLIYRIDLFQDVRSTISAWRKAVQDNGFQGIYLCVVRSHMHTLSDEETIALGFDAIVEFQPHSRTLLRRKTGNLLRYLIPRIVNYISKKLNLQKYVHEFLVVNSFDYKYVANKAMDAPPSTIKCFPCVMPSWDNSARRKSGASIIQNDDPIIFENWLKNAASRVSEYDKEEQIVFINAWNEWAEGCHLEPDLRNGMRFLDAVKRVFKK